MSGLMNGARFHGVRNASTMPTFKARKVFDPDKLKAIVEDAKKRGLIKETYEQCKRCSNPVEPGNSLCLAHGMAFTIGRQRNAIHITKQCLFCKKDFITAYKYAMYCGSYCKYKMADSKIVKVERKKKEITCKGKGCKTRITKLTWNHKYCETCRPLYRKI